MAVRLPEGAADLAEVVRTLDAEGLRVADLRLHSPALVHQRVPRQDAACWRARATRTSSPRASAGRGDRPGVQQHTAHADRRAGAARDAQDAAPALSDVPDRGLLSILLAVNASGLRAATYLPGFPTHSYVSFAIAVAFIQGATFAQINTGTNLAEDIDSGFFNRLALTPLRRATC